MKNSIVRNVLVVLTVVLIAVAVNYFMGKQTTEAPPPPAVMGGEEQAAGMAAPKGGHADMFDMWLDKIRENAEIVVPNSITDGVAATVNGVAVSAEKLEKRMELRRQMFAGMAGHGAKEPGKEVPEEDWKTVVVKLIDEELLRQEAEKRGIVVTPEFIDTEMEMKIAEFGGKESFTKMLAENGMSEEHVRMNMEKETLKEQLLLVIMEEMGGSGMHGGMEMPEGMKMPEGMENPHGGAMPEGMENPHGAAAPESAADKDGNVESHLE